MQQRWTVEDFEIDFVRQTMVRYDVLCVFWIQALACGNHSVVGSPRPYWGARRHWPSLLTWTNADRATGWPARFCYSGYDPASELPSSRVITHWSGTLSTVNCPWWTFCPGAIVASSKKANPRSLPSQSIIVHLNKSIQDCFVISSLRMKGKAFQ